MMTLFGSYIIIILICDLVSPKLMWGTALWKMEQTTEEHSHRQKKGKPVNTGGCGFLMIIGIMQRWCNWVLSDLLYLYMWDIAGHVLKSAWVLILQFSRGRTFKKVMLFPLVYFFHIEVYIVNQTPYKGFAGQILDMFALVCFCWNMPQAYRSLHLLHLMRYWLPENLGCLNRHCKGLYSLKGYFLDQYARGLYSQVNLLVSDQSDQPCHLEGTQIF